MAYNIYVEGELNAVCRSEYDVVIKCVTLYREVSDHVNAYEVSLDGVETPYDWKKSYQELCNG
jgi:hypothetical protein